MPFAPAGRRALQFRFSSTPRGRFDFAENLAARMTRECRGPENTLISTRWHSLDFCVPSAAEGLVESDEIPELLRCRIDGHQLCL